MSARPSPDWRGRLCGWCFTNASSSPPSRAFSTQVKQHAWANIRAGARLDRFRPDSAAERPARPVVVKCLSADITFWEKLCTLVTMISMLSLQAVVLRCCILNMSLRPRVCCTSASPIAGMCCVRR